MSKTRITTREDILEKLPTMSSAIRAMVDGLRELDGKPGHAIDMQTFGEERLGICYGCAATACVLHAWPDFPLDVHERIHVRKDSNPVEEFQMDRQLWIFENAIDDFRRGMPYELLQFYGVSDDGIPAYLDNQMVELDFTDENWEEESIKAIRIAEQMETLGL